MDDVAQLTRASDYSRFVGTGVDRSVSNAAMKKLFSDPHFNVMDGLDVYIDDYGKPDPIPESMLRRMTQSKRLGLFDDETPEADATSGAAKAPTGSAGTEAAPSDAGNADAASPGAAPPDGDAGDRREAGQETGDANGVAPATVAPATAPLASTDGTAPPRLPQSETAAAGGEPEDLLR
jgi:hypothetical protein